VGWAGLLLEKIKPTANRAAARFPAIKRIRGKNAMIQIWWGKGGSGVFLTLGMLWRSTNPVLVDR
jgi:hypothetical protein